MPDGGRDGRSCGGLGRRRSPRAAALDRPRDGAGGCDLHPGAKYAIGPAIEDGFYYDFELPEPLSSDDLPAIEARMRELVAADVPFIREEVARAEALERFADQPFKVEIIQGLGDAEVEGEVGGGDPVTLYRNGGWADLCLGPHVPSTGRLGAFRLTNVAGAYWRGDEQRPMLPAIYGTAWASEADLEAYLDPPGGGGEARPSQARAAARPVLVAGRARPRPVDLASARRDLPQAARGLRPRPAPRARLRPGRDAAYRALRPVGDVAATWRSTPTTCIRRWRRTPATTT